jgi:hypothetical protein
LLVNPLGITDAEIQGLVPTLVSQLLPSLGGGLGSLPLPSLLGLQPIGREVSRLNQVITIFLNLQ